MSYDLRIAPRDRPPATQATVEAVDTALRQAGAEPYRGQLGRYRIIDPVAGHVDLDVVAAGATVVQIEVSTTFSDASPVILYSCCARISRLLAWQTFDPQGGVWYSPSELEEAATADGQANGSTIGIGSLLVGGCFLFGAFMWVITGARVGSLGFVVVVALAVATLAVRVWEYVTLRGATARRGRTSG